MNIFLALALIASWYSADWEPLVSEYFPPDAVPAALEVIQCESQGDPGIENRGGSGALGLFQIKPKWWSYLLRPGESLLDAEANVRVASIIYRESGWRHWVCKPTGHKPVVARAPAVVLPPVEPGPMADPDYVPPLREPVAEYVYRFQAL